MRKKRLLFLIVFIAFIQLILYTFVFHKIERRVSNLSTSIVSVPITNFPEFNSSLVIPVLVIAFNRPSVERCLQSIIRARPSSTIFPLIVSQDGDHPETKNIIQSFPQVYYMQHTNQTDYPLPKKKKKLQGYYHLSRHYKWALDRIFTFYNFSSCIIVEDDLEVSNDFFELMLATLPILSSDPTLYCVSAWNDNGKPELVDKSRSDLLHRTDFFPGLGWMLTRQLWLEMREGWPDAFWDDWMRSPEVRKGRACLRPEITRTLNFGIRGVSNGLHFKNFLGKIKLYDGFTPFTKLSFNYLSYDTYNEELLWRVYSTKEVEIESLWKDLKLGRLGNVRVTYSTRLQFEKIAKTFGVMSDHKSGIPRTAYRGIVALRHLGRAVYIAPIYDWRGYVVNWK